MRAGRVCSVASMMQLMGKRRKECGAGSRSAGEQERGDEVVKAALSLRAVLTCQSLALNMSLTELPSACAFLLWQVLQIMGNMWRALPPAERRIYELEAERSKVRYVMLVAQKTVSASVSLKEP